MAVRILEKNGIDNTNIDGAGFNKFIAGGYDGVIKGILNQCQITASSQSALSVDTGELLVGGFRVVLNSATQFTMGATPSSVINYQIVAEIVVDTDSEVSFRLFIQPSSIELVKNNLFLTENGNGTYQLQLGTFDYGSSGIQNLTTTFTILDNDYKNYVISKISELNTTITTALNKKVGVTAQSFSEAEKRQARLNIGAISEAQSVDNVKYVFIVGQTPLDNDWLSATNGGEPLTPQTEIIYIIKTAGVYFNQQYIYDIDSDKYQVTAKPSDSNKQDTMQFSTMPDAANYNGLIVQYIGSTDGTYVKGRFYLSDGTNWSQYNTQTPVDISNKADKVSSATNGNFAALDSNGNLTDSTKKPSDFMSSSEKVGKNLSINGNTLSLKDQDGNTLGNSVTIPQTDVSGKEDKSNKVTSLSSSSTDTQYPSAKCVYDIVGDVETLLGGI